MAGRSLAAGTQRMGPPHRLQTSRSGAKDDRTGENDGCGGPSTASGPAAPPSNIGGWTLGPAGDVVSMSFSEPAHANSVTVVCATTTQRATPVRPKLRGAKHRVPACERRCPPTECFGRIFTSSEE